MCCSSWPKTSTAFQAATFFMSTCLAERYERRSVMITSNLVFSKWDQIFKDPMTTLAAIDRLVHHATILEFDGESVRAKKAKTRSVP
jgi:DNA replication protein DnaC